jgi:hypothetical protein
MAINLAMGTMRSRTAAPLAILDLAGGKPRVLTATNHIPGESDGPCSESDPQWSPNAKWILFNCENGAVIVDPQGKTVRDLKIDVDDAGSSAVGWVGTRCVLYVEDPETDGHFDFDHEAVKLLNLTTLKSTDAATMLNKFTRSTGGLLRASDDALIRQMWPTLIVQTRTKRWELKLKEWYQGPQTVSAELLTGWDRRSIPAECR